MVRNSPSISLKSPSNIQIQNGHVYNILVSTLGFTSGIWLLSRWSSPYFVSIRMMHMRGYLLPLDIEKIWAVISEVPSGNPEFCCPIWISLFHFTFYTESDFPLVTPDVLIY